MRKIVFILAFFAVLASVQALSFNYYDVNTSQTNVSLIGGDGNTFFVSSYSDGTVKAAMFDPVALQLDG